MKLKGYLYNHLDPQEIAPEGEPVKAFAFADSQAEAEWIAQQIFEMGQKYICPKCNSKGYTDKGVSILNPDGKPEKCEACNGVGRYGNFAVCYRMRAVGARVERALLHAGIPFVNLNGASFWSFQTVQMTWRYLQLIVNGHVDAYKYVYRMASNRMVQPGDITNRDSGELQKRRGEPINHRWLSSSFLQRYPTLDSLLSIDLPNLKSSKGFSSWAVAGVKDFRYTVDEIAKVYAKDGFHAAIDWIIENVTIPWYMLEHGVVNELEDGSVMDDMEVVREVAENYDNAADFLEFVTSIQSMGDDAYGAVTIGTFHKVKGGEWPIVFVAGMSETICPTVYAMGLVKPDNNVINPPPTDSSMNDERFCAYVGITRAKEVCFITCPLVWRKRFVAPSRFVAEAGLVVESVGGTPDSTESDLNDSVQDLLGSFAFGFADDPATIFEGLLGEN